MIKHAAIHINQLIELAGPEELGTHRVLYIDTEAREVAIFDVTDPSALPAWIAFDALEEALREGKGRALADDPYLPDLRPDDQLSSASIRVRNRRLEVIGPLVSDNADPTMPILRGSLRGKMIAEATARHEVGKDKIYNWLRLWWRHGQLDNALVPQFGKCGQGPRQPRGAKLGRPLTVSKSADDHVGANITEAMKRLIVRGVKMFYSAKPGKGRRSKQQAYQQTLQAFFYKRLEMKDGLLTPIVWEGVEDDNRLPTFRQWNYHCEKYLKEKGRLAERYDEREMALRRRPVLGSSQHLSKGPGDLFLIDATVADVHLLSSYDKRWTIGRPIIYLVVDHYSRMVVGLHVGLEGPNWTGAMMALANAFVDKVEFCKRYGVEITYDDWPCDVAPAQLTADRGEVLSAHADYIVPGFRMTVHNTPSFRADFKSFVEGQFKITNEMGIKRMPGWVDKLRERGGPDYRYDAVLDLAAFTEMLIRLVLHNNRGRPLASNIPPDYPLDDDAKPVPLELWNWGLSNGTPSIRRFPPNDVKRNLLPTFDAITTRQGLSAFGGRLHYTLPRAIDEGWFVRAPTRGGRKHKLAIDPRDVSVAYLRRPDGGLEECQLTPADHRRFAGRSVPDVEDTFDRDRKREAGSKRQRIQRDADIAAQLDAIKERMAKERRDKLNAAGMSRPNVKSTTPLREVERDIKRTEEAFAERKKEAPPLLPTEEDDDDEHVYMPD